VIGGPVRVGTENRAKLEAVRSALAAFALEAAELEIVPVGVTSGVPEQPIGWEEIMTGARNRAWNAFTSGAAVLGVGIEDGLVSIEAGADDALASWLNVGCAWITDGDQESRGFSSGFAYPRAALESAVRDQAPIGDLFDAQWAEHRAPGITDADAPSGRGEGNIGRLTGGRLDRADYGRQAVICALVPFLHRDLYD
jgi:inosine/xanthosine triphosphatase